jgi:phosphoribosyl 1,2-cyclic phosphodiesterase
VDAGISCRRITASLRELGLILDEVSAVLITHSHTDHVSGLQTLLKRTRFPVFATARTGQDLCLRLPDIDSRLVEVDLLQPFSLGDVNVTAFPTSHDAPGSCGFRLDTADGGVGILTDTGYVTDEAASVLPGVDLAVLEANHDVETLRSGPYPYYLKQRVLGREGHLCNEDAARFAVTLAEAGASEIVLAHLSRENNTPAMAAAAVETALSAAGLTPVLSVAPRDTLSGVHTIPRRAVCRK